MKTKRPKRIRNKRPQIAAVLTVAASSHAAFVSADDREAGRQGQGGGRYVSGDFHNHTTCSDGTLSLQKLVDKSTNTFDLDWFVQAGHGGNSARNCTLKEDPFEPVAPALGIPAADTIPADGQPAESGHGPNQTWVDTLPNGEADIKGDVVLQNDVRSMWKWQEVQEFIYPVIEAESRQRGKPVFVGLEQVVPGHEHASTAVIDGQLPAEGAGNADAVAQYEYCFDRADTDTSRGADNKWDCAVPGSDNAKLDANARKILIASGDGSGIAGHAKTLEGIKWLSATAPDTSYYVPAHLERAGAFNPNDNKGFNVEHLRDFNNVAPEVAFGFESMPGHQAEAERGSYTTNAVGGGTYGGSGIYAAAIGGVWDALLGEGRSWWFFASSDFHNRGSFGPDQRESTADFYPGEYTKDFVAVNRKGGGRGRNNGKFGPQEIVDGLRSGNSYVVNGGLIERLGFVACSVKTQGESTHEEAISRAAERGEPYRQGNCATLGETLTVAKGEDVVLQIALRDPSGKNNSPYSFPNPSLQQIGVTQPLDQPVLDHVDLIGGKISGKVDPSDTARYAGLIGTPAASNPSAALVATWGASSWKASGEQRRMSYRISAVDADQYVRLRGTNLPAATPFETDSKGNPLLDFGTALQIPCSDAACPEHLAKNDAGAKTSSFDVAAWADLWFYSNPIFIRVKK